MRFNDNCHYAFVHFLSMLIIIDDGASLRKRLPKMMELKALNVPTMTEEVADKLRTLLQGLDGIEHFYINLEGQELRIIFDEGRLGFQLLSQRLATAGCPLRSITAVLLQKLAIK